MRTAAWIAMAVAAVSVVAGLVSLRRPEPLAVADRVGAHAPAPSIFCEFFDFMHKTVVASYDFSLDRGAPSPLALRAQVSPDGTRLVYPETGRPIWAYSIDDDTPTAIAPDGETRIVLYGLKPNVGGVIWSEAGVRSNATRNLEGRCRQAYLDRTALGSVTPSTEGKGKAP